MGLRFLLSFTRVALMSAREQQQVLDHEQAAHSSHFRPLDAQVKTDCAYRRPVHLMLLRMAKLEFGCHRVGACWLLSGGEIACTSTWMTRIIPYFTKHALLQVRVAILCMMCKPMLQVRAQRSANTPSVNLHASGVQAQDCRELTIQKQLCPTYYRYPRSRSCLHFHHQPPQVHANIWFGVCSVILDESSGREQRAQRLSPRRVAVAGS